MRIALARTLGSRAESGVSQWRPVETFETTKPAFSTLRQLAYLRVCSAHLKPRNVTEPELDAIVSCLLYEFESLLEAPTLRNHVVADRFFHGTSFTAPLFNRTWPNSEASKTSFEGLHGNLLLKATDILEASTARRVGKTIGSSAGCSEAQSFVRTGTRANGLSNSCKLRITGADR